MPTITYKNFFEDVPDDYAALNKKGVEKFLQQFIAAIPGRIKQITDLVRLSDTHTNWQPDYTTTSIQSLASYLTLFMNDDQVRSQVTIETSNFGRSMIPSIFMLSVSIDVTVYMAACFMHQHPELKWSIYRYRKTEMRYNQPCIELKQKYCEIFPIHVGSIISFELADLTFVDGSLVTLYRRWESHHA